MSLALAIIAFVFVIGPAPLDPTNIAWLADHDAATNYLGWAFYRASPWSWPIAANPDYGMDIAGSVMMADANPLLAMVFKLLGPILPEPFQYFGWWLLGCFLLQALFARAIAVRIGADDWQRPAIVLLFLFAPCFLARAIMPAIFHLTLCGQWLILAAIWLYLSPDMHRRAWLWGALLTLTILIHPYLLAMVAAIWGAELWRGTVGASGPALRRLLLGAAAGLAAMAATAWLTGVLWLAKTGDGSVHAISIEWGFGIYKANLLSPVDPRGWSWLLPAQATTAEEVEGFAYLGAGVLALLVAALVVARRVPAWPRWLPHLGLGLALALLGLLAVTPYVALGSHVVHVPWPAPLEALGHMFRSSGRFAWPLVYWLMVALFWVVVRGSARRPATLILWAAAIVQIVDSSAGWRGAAEAYARRGDVWPSALTSPFWSEAAGRYRAVRMILPRNRYPAYRDIDAWALRHGLKTDVIYLARYDAGSFDALVRRRAAELKALRLPADTLWITDGVPAADVVRLAQSGQGQVTTADGIPVFAPGMKAR
ncbi:DUF6311 domain-containing protein [Rhizorhabdus sp. FW153]|uniref:DUF6311 domain-containing protein n=1 Tax=Rhizorhabdus sp. FW153 TaxID=3400216 RepID=UPI003CEE91EB